ncbi:MAG: VWA domain-containing protein [Steroidobacteraceae bacterium]
MIHLAWPWMALLLPAPLLSYRVRRAVQPSGSAIFLPFAAPLAARESGVPTSRHGRALFAAAWIALVLAAMRPQWLGRPVPAPTSGRQIFLAIDVSGSMATQDMGGHRSRLQVVQRVAGEFIAHRQGDRVGLILFGTRPYIQAPMTADLAAVHQFLDEAVVGVAGSQTAIGDAIGLAIKRLRADGSLGRNARGARQPVLILLTDGQSNAGVMPPIEAARLAAQVGLRIYTIGVGAAPGIGPLGFQSGNGDLDQSTLRAIAEATGGEYFRATDASALAAIYRQIERLAPAPGRKRWLRPVDEWFAWPLALAVLLSIPAAWIGSPAWA